MSDSGLFPRFSETIRVPRWLAVSVAAFVLALSAVPTSLSGIQETTASPAQAAVPQAVVAVIMGSSDLQVTDVKFRGFWNKIENKFIPLTDFDFAANLTDELVSALAEDKRAAWRPASTEEKEKLGVCFGPKSWKQQPLPQTQVEADRLLLVGVGYSAFLHVSQKRLDLFLAVRMAERKTGRVLWKKMFSEKTGLPGKLEELQVENQKGLKEALNKLMEKIVPEVKKHIVRSQI